MQDDKFKEFNVKIPVDVKKHMMKFAKDLVTEADRQEAEFLFPFLKEQGKDCRQCLSK